MPLSRKNSLIRKSSSDKPPPRSSSKSKVPNLRRRSSSGKAEKEEDENLDIPSIALNNGITMPVLGLGCWKKDFTGSGFTSCAQAVDEVLMKGYRHIDTGEKFLNLREIGVGIKGFLDKQRNLHRDETITRDDLFITGKIWAVHNGRIAEAYAKICGQLQTTYLDIVYLHFPAALEYHLEPVPHGETRPPRVMMSPESPEGDLLLDEYTHFVDAWAQMQQLLMSGKTRAIGLCNFNKLQLETLLKHPKTYIKPQVLQIEVHPLLKNLEMIEFCRQEGIVISAHGPQGALTSSQEGWKALEKRLSNHLNVSGSTKSLGKIIKTALQQQNVEEGGSAKKPVSKKKSKDGSTKKKVTPKPSMATEAPVEPAADENTVTATAEEVADAASQPTEPQPITEETVAEEPAAVEAVEVDATKPPNAGSDSGLEGEPQTPPEINDAEETPLPPSRAVTEIKAVKKKVVKKRGPSPARKKKLASREPSPAAGKREALAKRESKTVEEINEIIKNDPVARMSYGLRPSLQGFNQSTLKFKEEVKVRSIASSHKVNSPQVILRWSLQLGCAILQNQWDISTIRHSSQIFKFELSDTEMETLFSINKHHRSYPSLALKLHKHYPFTEDDEIIKEQEVRERQEAEARKEEARKKKEAVLAAQKTRRRNASSDRKQKVPVKKTVVGRWN